MILQINIGDSFMKIALHFFALFIFFLLITGCSLLKKDYSEIAHAITLRTAKQLEKEKGMKLVGTSGGMIDQVNSLGMHLYYYSPQETPEARKLALFVVDKFLHNINSDEKVRPYLNNYPFKVEDLEIFLYFRHPNRFEIKPRKICNIVIDNGQLTFNTRNKETGRLTTLFEETIEEAREKVSNMTSE